MENAHQLRRGINHMQLVELLHVSDGRQRCKALGHETRLATHYSQHAHFCPECANRIKHQPKYGGGSVLKEIKR